ncbi:WXG100 family type VII secretion target [Nocardia yamanashiensis]|uniref:WXG100 family type VII secretion target n=1 Tax=Nocardia TaxID=1817 RepID=UPI0008338AC1|nr:MULTISPECIES: WXG100 family type VII secretion target [Nocardia]UGT39615.1 WXG100 family type VII secretion target [Nocardia yamanashiensis]
MAGAFEASNELIQAKAQEFKKTHETLMIMIRDLKRDEDNMTVGSKWEGEARKAFNAFMERYYFQADKLNDKLMQTSENLIKAGSSYEDHDRDYSAQVNAQMSSLDLPAV